MADRLIPDAIVETSGLVAGILSSIDDDPTSPDAYWLAAQDNDSVTVVRVSFAPALEPKPGVGLQVMRAWVRKRGGTGTVTCTPQLYENGALVRSGSPITINSTSGELITLPFDSSEISNYANTEFRLETAPAGGNPSKRATVEFGAIDWLFSPDQIPNPVLSTASTFASSPISKLVAPTNISVASTASTAQVSPVSTALGFRVYWVGLDADFYEEAVQLVNVDSLASSFASDPVSVKAAAAPTALASSFAASAVAVSAINNLAGTDQTAVAPPIAVTGASTVLGTASAFASGQIEQPGGAALVGTPSGFAAGAVSVLAQASVEGTAANATVSAVGSLSAASLGGSASEFASGSIGSSAVASLVSASSSAAVSPITVTVPPVELAGTASQFASGAFTLRAVNRPDSEGSAFAASAIATAVRSTVASTGGQSAVSPIGTVSRIHVLGLGSGFLAPPLGMQDLVVDVAGTGSDFAAGFVVVRLARPASEVFVGVGDVGGRDRVVIDPDLMEAVDGRAVRELVA